jgi:hypothetical protein
MAIQLNNGVTDEYVRLNNAATPISTAATDAWSMACWLYRDTDMGTTENIALMATDGVGVATTGSGFRISPSDVLQTVTSGGTTTVRSPQAVGQWVNAAATFGNGTGTSYWGTTPGTLTAAGSRANVAGVLDSLIVGRSVTGTTLPFSGRIAHLRLWTGALSEAEFEAESLSLTAVKTSGLWVAWEWTAADWGINAEGTFARDPTMINCNQAGNYIAGPLAESSSQSNAPRANLLRMLRNA